MKGSNVRTIAIDGACRRNGQPDCISAGACFVVNKFNDLVQTKVLTNIEENSTSQRGELLGLILALEHFRSSPTDTAIITDSEYLFNTVTKGWLSRWRANDWKTAEGADVKNQDLWNVALDIIESSPFEVVAMYHIKGHLLSVGAKKSEKLFLEDNSGYSLYTYVHSEKTIQPEKLEHAVELCEANNGFIFSEDVWQMFAAMNVVADTAANLRLTAYETAKWAQMLQ